MSALPPEQGGASAPARLTARAYGRVQGVGFRASVARRAAELGLTGWAANLDDGSVQIVAEGPRPACEQLLAYVEGGGVPGRVTKVEHHWGPPLGGLTGFTQR